MQKSCDIKHTETWRSCAGFTCSSHSQALTADRPVYKRKRASPGEVLDEREVADLWHACYKALVGPAHNTWRRMPQMCRCKHELAAPRMLTTHEHNMTYPEA